MNTTNKEQFCVICKKEKRLFIKNIYDWLPEFYSFGFDFHKCKGILRAEKQIIVP